MISLAACPASAEGPVVHWHAGRKCANCGSLPKDAEMVADPEGPATSAQFAPTRESTFADFSLSCHFSKKDIFPHSGT